ncbi:MAG TPA: TAT-variant-translocated molybdopterin oxidoreductase [Terriglobia bacterium]|nr:TAT-variant-translocated molybdopterin oxidoreductase [Terriglobia bacterium]
MNGHDNSIDLIRLREMTDGDRQRFWRSLEELAESPGFQASAQHEFPVSRRAGDAAAQSASGVSRRDLLKLVGASTAVATLAACTKLPVEKIVPYVRQPEEFVPGVPLYYATALPFGGYAQGMLVESHLGRPTKVEGNPDHPASLGAASLFAQASVLTLYDPDRSQVPTHLGRVASWDAFQAEITDALNNHRPSKGAGIRLLTENVTSPTLAQQIRAFLAQFPSAKWHQYEPCGFDAAREGSRLAFGEYVNTVYRFARAEVILALDSDFLCSGAGAVRYAHDFADKRRVVDARSTLNRLYAVESTPLSTGAVADHRLRLRSSDIEGLVRAVAAGLGVSGVGQASVPAGVPANWIPALVRDLQAHRGASIVIVGDQQPPVVHGLAHAINHALGNAGATVIHTEPVEANPGDGMQSLSELVADMKAGQVELLVIMGANPVYNAPADLGFAEQFMKVKLRVRLGLYNDETSELCHWHIPESHYLEAWGDCRAYDGTASVIQPLIAPLYTSKSAYEFMAALLNQPNTSAHDLVYQYWTEHAPADQAARFRNFEAFWESSLNNGTIAGTVFAPKQVALQGRFAAPGGPPDANPGDLEIVFRPDPAIWDGSFANNGWLQELPRPLTKLTWDNAAQVSPATAQRLSLNREDVVKLTYEGRELSAPVLIVPGHADNSVTLHLGYGRRRAGGIGTGVGVNAYSIRTSANPGFGVGLQIQKTGARYHLVTTQNQHIINQDGRRVEEESQAAFKRDIVRVATLTEFQGHPDFAADPPEETTQAPSMYPAYNYKKGYQWGMSIDLNSCTGCNACIVACYAENNIPVVGKEQVDDGRDMQWIRVDTYYRGSLDAPEAYNQVVMCMQCENAPCEYVCPVGATVHSPEGLNVMVYNRCVGTRYCSNNCPYKVRRFNFYLYSDWTTPSLYPLRNPDVTVRSRGVMEKCSYCLQRINEVKIKAEREDRAIHDGEILTACQQTCPTQAIVFGNINDPASRVARLKAQSRQYGLLRDLNTRPRTTYLARVTNPNPELAGPRAQES